MLRAENCHTPDFYNEVQKEALQRLEKKNVIELVVNPEKEKGLKERSVDRRVGREQYDYELL